jgi:hypothetical protein
LVGRLPCVYWWEGCHACIGGKVAMRLGRCCWEEVMQCELCGLLCGLE